MQAGEKTLKLYSELASWWPLLSAPGDYAEEAEFFRKVLFENSAPQTLLELGCGGGNNASHLKKYFRLTLTDVSEAMLAMSRALNPECEHLQGDMRSLRLSRLFDAVFIHDAIDYMITAGDLYRALETASAHCRPGGAVLIAPDFVRENFHPSTEHGGHDGKTRGLRYLEWTYDPDPNDTWYVTDFAYLLREDQGVMRVEHDRHIMGLFGRDVWLNLMQKAGLQPKIIPDPFARELFLGMKA